MGCVSIFFIVLSELAFVKWVVFFEQKFTLKWVIFLGCFVDFEALPESLKLIDKHAYKHAYLSISDFQVENQS